MRVLAAILATAAVACTDDAAPPTYGDGLGTPENPVPEDNLAYDVTSRIDVTGDAIPPEVHDATAGMTAFSSNPAHALLAAADPTMVQDLKTQIGSTLAGQLEGWMNTEIDKAKVATKTMRQFATDVVSITESTLTHFYLPSTLSMTPAKTTHVLAGINFRPLALDIVVPVGGLTADVLTQHPTLSVAEGGAFTLGDQKFGLAFGDHAWSGITLATTTLYGSGVQGTLSTGVNCDTVAHAVAARCYSSSCVGHESQLRAVCASGVAGLSGTLNQKVIAFHLEVFRFMSGTATMVDTNGDGLADRIDNGTWSTQIKLVTLREATAMFTAKK
jgi:hypothetical protein